MQQEGFGEVVETFNFATKAIGVKMNSTPASQEQAQHDQAKCSSRYLCNPRRISIVKYIYIIIFFSSPLEKNSLLSGKRTNLHARPKEKNKNKKLLNVSSNGMGKKKLQVNNILTTLQCKAIQP